MPRLAGNFFSLDLDKARAAFESVPWVRQADVRRVWPDRLAVQLDEHQPVALWLGDDGNDRLVNAHGEVFEANLGDVEDDDLPTLGRPRRQLGADAGAVPAAGAAVRPRRAGRSAALQLSGRGSWRVELDSGAAVELGRGSEDELVARSERFVRTLSARSPAATSATWNTPTCAMPTATRCGCAASPPPSPRPGADRQETEVGTATWPRNTRIWSSAWTSAPPR